MRLYNLILRWKVWNTACRRVFAPELTAPARYQRQCGLARELNMLEKEKCNKTKKRRGEAMD